ncbi:patatin [Candidatus Poribacteria bacterium]|nr:patatin [Candidatus Poribacteria bacterium]
MIKILSIDGGGIRGIIPAILLAEIEKRTQKPISELFHLIAGTSTGGLLALSLVKPDENRRPEYTAQKVIDLYEIEGENIFSRSVIHRIRSLESLTEEKYPSEGIEGVLRKYFNETHLKEAIVDVLIASYEIEQRIPWFFRSSRAKTQIDYDFPMWQVARATTAAPTFFEPLKINADCVVDYYALIDGGICANNPAMCAYVEAKSNYPDSDDFMLLSLGTGKISRPIIYSESKDWGLAGWAQPILEVVFDSISATVDYQLQKILNLKDREKHYYRFQPKLNEDHAGIDNTTPENIRMLKLITQELIRDCNDEINSLCDLLMR